MMIVGRVSWQEGGMKVMGETRGVLGGMVGMCERVWGVHRCPQLEAHLKFTTGSSTHDPIIPVCASLPILPILPILILVL